MAPIRILLSTLAVLLHGVPALAQDGLVGSASRSDSINLLHTRIALDLTNTGTGLVHATAQITFTPLVAGIQQLDLDLQLPVDSVVLNGAIVPFSQQDELLRVDLQAAYGPGDTLVAAVSYGGNPSTDPSGFGGFYTLANYQYDLGVAFDAVPHSFGRAWFPCFDNFVERCTFEYLVHTTNGRSVLANGALQAVDDLGNGERISHWAMDEPIPAYLASVAAGNYATIQDTFPSIAGSNIPVTLAALPNDTADMRASFIHLQDAFNTFEQWFGPYRWNRVGYVLTSAGAMEHATNICYPDFAADGTLANEDLVAHELSHHWFGNLITCATPEEMYINEGFADFCAMLFIEGLYGEAAYKAKVRENHRQVVSAAHLRDDGWYALAAVPSNITYGVTSYSKGANIARTLRATLGDSLFRAGIQQVFANNAYSAMGSLALRDSLSTATGVDLTDFFADWILQPGGAAFMVDSFQTTSNGPGFQTTVYIRQKTRGGAELFLHVPVTISAVDASGGVQRQLVDLGGALNTVNLTTDQPPSTIRLNDDERLALATTWDTTTITATGQKYLSNTDLRLITDNLAGPTKVRAEEFWVPADEADGFFVSPDRWWRLESDVQAGTDITLRFTVDGRAGFPGVFDQGLTQDAGGTNFHEDSLVVLYRPGPHAPWTVKPAQVNTSGSATDKSARLDMPGMAAGDYTIAWRNTVTAVPDPSKHDAGWRYYPDPATDEVTVIAPAEGHNARLLLHDVHGRPLAQQRLHKGLNRIATVRFGAQTILLSVQPARGGTIRLGQLHITR